MYMYIDTHTPPPSPAQVHNQGSPAVAASGLLLLVAMAGAMPDAACALTPLALSCLRLHPDVDSVLSPGLRLFIKLWGPQASRLPEDGCAPSFLSSLAARCVERSRSPKDAVASAVALLQLVLRGSKGATHAPALAYLVPHLLRVAKVRFGV
jgi:hypothetical protein